MFRLRGADEPPSRAEHVPARVRVCGCVCGSQDVSPKSKEGSKVARARIRGREQGGPAIFMNDLHAGQKDAGAWRSCGTSLL